MAKRINTREWSEFYRVTQRSVQKWVNDLKPVEHPTAMAKLILADTRSSKSSRARAAEILSGNVADPSPVLNGAGELPPSNLREQTDPLWEQMQAAGDDALESGDTNTQLRRLRAFYLKKLEEANRIGDQGGIKLYTDQAVQVENQINKNLLMAKRLGLDAGELMKRETVERFLDAMAFLLMRGCDDMIDDLSKRCVGKSYPEEIRPLVEEYVLTTRILRPFRGVINQASGLGLPAWFVSQLQSSADACIAGEVSSTAPSSSFAP